eukprot:6768200-Pyramimonas_sp.AAC.1
MSSKVSRGLCSRSPWGSCSLCGSPWGLQRHLGAPMELGRVSGDLRGVSGSPPTHTRPRRAFFC